VPSEGVATKETSVGGSLRQDPRGTLLIGLFITSFEEAEPACLQFADETVSLVLLGCIVAKESLICRSLQRDPELHLDD